MYPKIISFRLGVLINDTAYLGRRMGPYRAGTIVESFPATAVENTYINDDFESFPATSAE